MHQRQNRKDLSFRYPIFNLFIPIDKLNVKRTFFDRFKLMSLSSVDYLDPENLEVDIKIKLFLKTKLNYEADHIVLQTMPRLFGYVFNPVSFWYCYKNESLDFVLCEVNNTFGDKHFYFVKPNDDKPTCLNKSFHVSPFLDIEGFYEFKFISEDLTSSVQIDYFKEISQRFLLTKIQLKKETFNPRSSLQIILRYGWMTPLVVLRIHYLALKLWARKIQFFKRPKPPEREITR